MKCLRRWMLPFAGTAAMLLGLEAGPAFANTAGLVQSVLQTPTSTVGCAAPRLTQPFLSAGDLNWYAPLPGQTAGSFTIAGWGLSGGARIVTTQLANGGSGTVLDLPAGSVAITPPICVTTDYPMARMQVRSLVGSQGVDFLVSYAGTNRWNLPQSAIPVHGRGTNWTLSDPIDIQPSATPGWQLARFALVPVGRSSEYQVYDIYVDPRMTR